MKKILFFIFAALAFVACEKDYQSVIEKSDLETVVHNNKVSLKQALLYAENSINGINPTTRSAERKVKSTELYVAKPATRSAEDVEVSFYLINYEDNEGFAMVSTDSRATPVYAYSDEGNLTPYDLENNPGLQIFMEGTIENYQNEVASPRMPQDPINRPDSIITDLPMPTVEYNGGTYYLGITTEDIVKEPLLTTYWHQNAPYGNDCPNRIGGCAPLAAAQIMAYHKHPAQFDGHTYNWDAITATPTLPAGSTGAIAAAGLIYDIAEAAGAVYNTWTTDIYTTHQIRNAIWFFSYNCSEPLSYDEESIMGDINDEQPILITGFDNRGEGHAWVIDGYNRRNVIYTYYYMDAPTVVYDTRVHTISTFFHCNLGWGGDSNGYYNANSFLHKNNLSVVYDITPNN
jgi:hypothetical protein